MSSVQLDLWMRDRAATGRHPRSRWTTQALVVAAGLVGVPVADLVIARGLARPTVRSHLRRLAVIGRVIERDGRWFAAPVAEHSEPVAP